MPSLPAIINLALIMFGFGLLIFVHELGHFIAAKWAGIRTQGFAIGMGPVIVSWRKGVGFRVGSTAKDTEKKVREHLARGGEAFTAGEETRTGAPEISQKRFFDAMDEMGLGETEYSLRWLPIGGFVSMLGQEDAKPGAASDDPRSYTRCPIGKRMIVVSAGVIMNLVLAVAFFIWAFMVGVPFEAPIVGGTFSDLPAATAMPTNAEQVGVSEPGLKLGDVILRVNGKEPRAFNDIMITAAMGRKGRPVELEVAREIGNEERLLHFSIVPEMHGGIQTLGILPARSTQLFAGSTADDVRRLLEEIGLAQQGVEPGVSILTAAGTPVDSWQAFHEQVRRSQGQPIETTWAMIDDEGNQRGETITATVPVQPELLTLYFLEDGEQKAAYGLFGLAPLAAVRSVEDDSPNAGELRAGDVFLKVADVEAPRWDQLAAIIAERRKSTIDAIIFRDGEEIPVELEVGSNGRVGIVIKPALHVPLVADPIDELLEPGAREPHPSPVAQSEIYPGSRILAVGGTPGSNWRDIRRALREATRTALRAGTGASVTLDIALRAPNIPRVTETIELSAEDVADLHALRWDTELASGYFEPIEVIQTANGNPFVAVAMGFDRTIMAIKHVYLTIIRLFQRSVSVDQLRGPVGIVHLGVQIADRGLMYLVYLLAMISVNLAVINFLPLPIVDGGLFLFLVYEKLKGRPPSVAFQNAVTIAGLLLIVTLFLVVTYNDIARLIVGA